jgi:hypothetical protein
MRSLTARSATFLALALAACGGGAPGTGSGGGNPGGLVSAEDPPVVNDPPVVDPAPACVPACAAATCGDDGCGGSCGSCAEGIRCTSGACVDPAAAGGPAWHVVASGAGVPWAFLWGSAADDIWAGGSSGSACQVAHYDGSTWTNSVIGTNFRCEALWGSAADDVWAVGGEPDPITGAGKGAVYRFDGSAWSRVYLGDQYFMAVSGSGRDDVWIARGTLQLLHWDGSSFASKPAPTEFSQSVTTLWVGGPDDAWAMGAGAWHWDGTHWTSYSSSLFPTQFTWSTWGSGGKDVWAVGNSGYESISGTAWHWNGDYWDVKQFPGGYGIHAVWGSGGAIRASLHGSILEWDGSAWTQVDTGLDLGWMSALWGSSVDDLWALGRSSFGTPLLLHYF